MLANKTIFNPQLIVLLILSESERSFAETVSTIELLKIGDEEALMLCKSRDILREVHAIEPLSDGHNFSVLSVAKNIFGPGDTVLNAFLVSYKVLLNLGHGYFIVGKLAGEFHRVSCIIWEEFQEESFHLRARSILKLNLLIGSTWTEERRV